MTEKITNDVWQSEMLESIVQMDNNSVFVLYSYSALYLCLFGINGTCLCIHSQLNVTSVLAFYFFKYY